MFAVIYSFNVKEGSQKEFERAWKGLTKLIYQYEGSLGSRLHKKSATEYIAYANWPNKESWQESGAHLPVEADEFSLKMRNACESIQTVQELEVLDDYLKSELFKN